MNTTLPPLAEDFLARLDRAAHSLPPQDRDELVAELRSHLQTGLAPGATDADVRNFLAGLGSPDDIVAAALPESPTPPAVASRPASPWGAVELVAVLALTVGALVLPVVGPLAGIVLVWVSTRWTRREKGIATVLTALPVLTIALGAAMLIAVGGSGEPSNPVPAPVVSSEGTP
jgi:uncharacterized membrane protein